MSNSQFDFQGNKSTFYTISNVSDFVSNMFDMRNNLLKSSYKLVEKELMKTTWLFALVRKNKDENLKFAIKLRT